MSLIVLVKWNVLCRNVNFVVILRYFGSLLEPDTACATDSLGIVEPGAADRSDTVLWPSPSAVERRSLQQPEENIRVDPLTFSFSLFLLHFFSRYHPA
jgi:hypothetical protein